MNPVLAQDNYLIIPNFIDSRRAKELSKEFVEVCNRIQPGGDNLVHDCQALYDYIPFIELLCEKLPDVNQLVGETLLPTYSYARVYQNGNTLKGHVDREACEVSLSIHLDGDTSWDIWVETPNKEKKYVSLDSGDALLYLGCVANHGRDIFTGKWYSQLFLHYVRSRGENSFTYFDKSRVPY